MNVLKVKLLSSDTLISVEVLHPKAIFLIFGSVVYFCWFTESWMSTSVNHQAIFPDGKARVCSHTSGLLLWPRLMFVMRLVVVSGPEITGT